MDVYLKYLSLKLKPLRIWMDKHPNWAILIVSLFGFILLYVFFLPKNWVDLFNVSQWITIISFIFLFAFSLVKLDNIWFESKRVVIFLSALLGIFLGFLMLRYFPDWVMSIQPIESKLINFQENFLIDFITKIQQGFYLQNSKIELKENLLIAIISAPIAFVIWSYRDKNEHDKIENQRFDTNLKYFEQVQEKLKGIEPFDFHLVKYKESQQEGLEKKYEQNDVSIKVSAILQLGDFIQGIYGEHLRKPAFCLLRSVWESYVKQSYLKILNLNDELKNKKLTKNDITWQSKSYYQLLQKDRIIQTLNLALIKGLTDKNSHKTASFEGFENDLHGLFLVGLNTYLIPDITLIFNKDLVLNSDVKLDFSHLRNIEFIGVELNGLWIICSTFYNVKFSKKSKLNSLFFDNCCIFNMKFSNVDINDIEIDFFDYDYGLDMEYDYYAKNTKKIKEIKFLKENNIINFINSNVNRLHSTAKTFSPLFVFHDSFISNTVFGGNNGDTRVFPKVILKGKVAFVKTIWKVKPQEIVNNKLKFINTFFMFDCSLFNSKNITFSNSYWLSSDSASVCFADATYYYNFKSKDSLSRSIDLLRLQDPSEDSFLNQNDLFELEKEGRIKKIE